MINRRNPQYQTDSLELPLQVVPYLYFENKVLKVAVEQQKKEWDTCILVIGKEGSGKSTVALHSLESIARMKETKPRIEWICQTLKDFINRLGNMKVGDVVMLDEGSDLASIKTLDKLSIAITKSFTVMRARCYISLICFTNLMRINTYFRHDRVKGLVYVKERGLAYFFTHDQLTKTIIPKLKKFSITDVKALGRFKPLFAFRFPKYEGELLESYLKQKDSNITETLTDLQTEYGALGKKISLVKSLEVIGHDKIMVRWLISKGLIKATEKLNGHFIIDLSEAIKWKEILDDREKYAMCVKAFKTSNSDSLKKIFPETNYNKDTQVQENPEPNNGETHEKSETETE